MLTDVVWQWLLWLHSFCSVCCLISGIVAPVQVAFKAEETLHWKFHSDIAHSDIAQTLPLTQAAFSEARHTVGRGVGLVSLTLSTVLSSTLASLKMGGASFSVNSVFNFFYFKWIKFDFFLSG